MAENTTNEHINLLKAFRDSKIQANPKIQTLAKGLNFQNAGGGSIVGSVSNPPATQGPSQDELDKAASAQRAAEVAKADAERRARLISDTQIQELGPADTSMAAGAAPAMAAYDRYTAEALGETPEQSMARADAAARQTAQAESDAAIRSAVKGARAGGAMGGQAALAGTGQGAAAYGTGMARGTQQYFDTSKFRTNLAATMGSEMAGRLTTAAQLKQAQDQANLAARTAAMQARTGAESAAATGGASAAQSQREAELGARTQRYTTEQNVAAQKYAAEQAAKASESASKRQAKSGIIGSAIGAVGGVLGAFSDERLKDNKEPTSPTEGLDKVGSYKYNYIDSDREEMGPMAQDLEKTAMKPAVIDTPNGKMIDIKKATMMNTGINAEHERRLKEVERLIKSLSDIRLPKKAEK